MFTRFLHELKSFLQIVGIIIACGVVVYLIYKGYGLWLLFRATPWETILTFALKLSLIMIFIGFLIVALLNVLHLVVVWLSQYLEYCFKSIVDFFKSSPTLEDNEPEIAEKPAVLESKSVVDNRGVIDEKVSSYEKMIEKNPELLEFYTKEEIENIINFKKTGKVRIEKPIIVED